MDTSYWNTIAPNYEQEIFNLFRHDKNQRLKKVIRQQALVLGDASTVADFGCGIGNGLELLAKSFHSIDAYDLSSKNIRKCKALYSHLEGVNYQRADLSQAKLPRAKYAFAICVCCLIMPSIFTRRKLLANVLSSIKKGGSLLLVVPSLESAAMVNSKLIAWNLREGMTPRRALREGFDPDIDIAATDIRQGVMPIEGVRTKHFCREELLDLLAGKVSEQKLFKVEYDWNSVFNGLPKSLQQHLPWDWALLAKK